MTTTPEYDTNSLRSEGLEIARRLDAGDSLSRFRSDFHIPVTDDQPEIYFVGNSLGLQPKVTGQYVQQELQAWRERGVRGHFEGDFPWMPYHEFLTDSMAEIVGAKPDELVMMNSLTVNLHLMMATFYQPQGKRNRILIEQHAFPSDHYAVTSRIVLSGHDGADCLVEIPPSEGVEYITTGDICDAIEREGDSLAMVLIPGVQYYTGQFFDLQKITAAAHAVGAIAGFDLAHAAGNVPMQLHDWDVDFACWCTYKYLNSGPGSVGGCFVHRRHATNQSLPRMAGWWGHNKQTRFQMENRFDPIPTAEGWQLSNPPILSLAAIRASLDLFQKAGGIQPLRARSVKLTGFFEAALNAVVGERVRVITPSDPDQRGCQLSLSIDSGQVPGKTVYERLETAGIRTDWREPNVIRAAPVPLYNTFEEVWKFVSVLNECLEN